MKKDARYFLNAKKKGKSGNWQLEGSRVQQDARTVLNLKRGKSIKKKQFVQNKARGGMGKFNKSQGIFTKTFGTATKAPDKKVKITNDGNILITAKSKGSQMVTQPPTRMPSFGARAFVSAPKIQVQKPVHQWAPADVDMDIEHIGINDVLDMESLPPAVIPTHVPQNRMMLSRPSVSDDMSAYRNTMVADQIAYTSAYQPARISVSNLHSSVSKQDIMELFGDVGLVKGVQMTQPGTAVVEFFSEEDASKACTTYHNRLLDGHPMKCYLQPIATPQRSAVSQRLGGRVQNISPIASTSSFVSNPRSRYNPRDVRFTVKLT